MCVYIYIYIKVNWSRYRPGVAQRVVRVITLLFHDRGTRRGWVVSSTPRPHFTPWKDPVPILQEAGWAPGPVWTGGKSRPHRDSIPDRPARSQSLYRLSYPAHTHIHTHTHTYIYTVYITWEYNGFCICSELKISSNKYTPKCLFGNYRSPLKIPSVCRKRHYVTFLKKDT